MLIFIAHTGRSLEVVVEPTTRVSAIQETLVGVTKVHVSNQILMCNGTPMDPAKDLSAYALPGTDVSGTKDVFLYNKTHLRLNGPPAQPEVAKPLTITESSPQRAGNQSHALDNASSPLIRALPQYERQFRQHLKAAQAGLHASRQRQQDCSDLVSEMEVQSRAIDSARSNVDHHYTYIHDQFNAFTQQYAVQRKAHADVLAGFERELEALAAVDLHPAAKTTEHTRLIHLVNPPRLREWAAECLACHQNLSEKVFGLEELFVALKADVEALFMQAPTVHLEALATQLHAMQPHLDELLSIVQVLESDNGQIKRLVQAAVQEVSSGGGGRGVTPLDNCQLMETMDENHASHLMPQVERYRAMFEHFYRRCLDDKNQMTRDVVAQLQRISGQQSKIQAMRNKLAIFREAAAKEDEMFAQLLLVRRIPAAYCQCLAECMRRQAFSDLYAGQARQMAERMGKLRQKERDKRDSFRKQVQAYIPVPLLAGLGLTQQPPHCQISLPPPAPGLPSITPADIQRAPLLTDPAVSASTLLPFRQHSAAPAASPRSAPAEEVAPNISGELTGAQALEMENARLRAELAVRYAEDCMRMVSQPGGAGYEQGGTLPSSAQQQQQVPTADVRKFQAAIAAKQDLVIRLERHLVQARQQSANYESRVHHLEARLAKMAARSQQGDVMAGGSAHTAASASMSSTSSSGVLPTVAESQEEPRPLPLTPVLTSPTRSISPATVAALPDPGAMLTTALHAATIAAGSTSQSGNALLQATTSACTDSGIATLYRTSSSTHGADHGVDTGAGAAQASSQAMVASRTSPMPDSPRASGKHSAEQVTISLSLDTNSEDDRVSLRLDIAG